MHGKDAILIALTLVLVMALACLCAQGSPGCGWAPSPPWEGFAPAPPASAPAPAPASAPAPSTPEQAAEAERELWLAEGAGGFDPERGGNDYHDAAPALDYSQVTTGLVADARMLENHARWVEEMKPWSGVAMRVDDLDEASEATTDFLGLRRPQAVAVCNPLQHNERDPATFAGNKKFVFNA